MGKNNKKKKNKKNKKRKASDVEVNENTSSEANETSNKCDTDSLRKKDLQPSSTTPLPNPLLDIQRSFLGKLTRKERDSFFSDDAVTTDRRAEIWMEQADIGEDAINKYSWATPDERAINVIKQFSPIIEIGCGTNAYWCRQMNAAGIDVVGYDVSPEKGGTISSKSLLKQTDFRVGNGGPEVLKHPKHANRTLFLCYPDENDTPDENGEPISMALNCLKYYKGDYIIHVGELYSDTTLSIDQAPWGRSSSPEFQQQLGADFHCLLRIGLSNWLHTVDALTVWKRSQTTTIVFEAEDEQDKDEEIHFRYIPKEERLPVDIAAPCLRHLLQNNSGISSHSILNDEEEVKHPETSGLLSNGEYYHKPKMKINPATDLESKDQHVKPNNKESLLKVDDTSRRIVQNNNTQPKKKKARKEITTGHSIKQNNGSTYACPW